VQDAEGERHVAVYTVAGRRLYVVLDIGLESRRERRLARDLIALVVFGTGLSAWLGWLWTSRAIEPVRRLARLVEVLDPARREIAKLAPEFAADEVGALAQAFDRYQEKLYEYVRRERTFTADASHELRTPLAVIRGAIEVMLDSGPTDAVSEARLRRMLRGSEELTDLLDALLLLARSDDLGFAESNLTDVDAVVRQLLHERSDALHQRRVTIEHQGRDGVLLMAPQRVLRVVIGNLLWATSHFAEGGTLRIALADCTLRIEHEYGSATREEPTRPSERGDRILGLGMIRRVCERFGWTLEERRAAGDIAGFELGFGGASRRPHEV
jgi:signal transduction histidine kinase